MPKSGTDPAQAQQLLSRRTSFSSDMAARFNYCTQTILECSANIAILNKTSISMQQAIVFQRKSADRNDYEVAQPNIYLPAAPIFRSVRIVLKTSKRKKINARMTDVQFPLAVNYVDGLFHMASHPPWGHSSSSER